MNRIFASILSGLISGQLILVPFVRAEEPQAGQDEGASVSSNPDPENESQPPAPFSPESAPMAPAFRQPAVTAPSTSPRRVLPTKPPTPALPAGAPAGRQAMRPGEMMFNFQDADIQAVVKTVSQITGKNFLIDPRVKGKLTIISTQPVSRSAVYQIFLAALKAQGFTTTEGPAGLLKIIPLGDAKQNAGVSSGVAPRRGEQTITHIVTVQHGSATQMVPLLRPLIAPTSQLAVYPPGNALIITDYADNIRNLLRIVDILDQRGTAEITIVPLRYASAVDIAE
ncbi:MAG: secretin N-terminal domain-containing protein, partial [Pseudomonadota bacterium]